MLIRRIEVGVRCFSILRGAQRNPISHELHGIIKWVRPDKLKIWEPQRTCDLKPLAKINPNWLQLEYRPFASIINELPENERKLFTVALGKRRHAVEVILEDTLDSVRRHKYDDESYEFKVAWMTVKIRNFQYQLQTDPAFRKHGGNRKNIKELVEKRKKYLSRLKNLDYKRFEWLLHMLSIIYKPNTSKEDTVERKKSVRRLTQIYCEAIKNKKMEMYKTELEAQKIPFLEEKLATLQRIKADEESMKIPCSVEEDIVKTIQQIENVKMSHLVLEPVPENQQLLETK